MTDTQYSELMDGLFGRGLLAYVRIAVLFLLSREHVHLHPRDMALPSEAPKRLSAATPESNFTLVLQ